MDTALNSLIERAYVLHTRPYRNQQYLADLFCAEEGCIRGIAPKSKRQPLSLFTPYWLKYKSREGLSLFSQFESLSMTLPLKEKRSLCAFYINELLVKLLRFRQSYASLFKLYEATLLTLCDKACDIEVVLRQFEQGLFKSLGYELEFDKTFIEDEQVIPGQFYHFSPDRGFVLVRFAKDTAKLFKGESLLAVHAKDFSEPETRLSAKRVHRHMIHFLLQGKELKTRELFQR